MSSTTFRLQRRSLCAASLLAAGLSSTGLAHASKRKFRLIWDFPAGSAPVNRLVNTTAPRVHVLDRQSIITANGGYHLMLSGGISKYEAFNIDRPDHSDMLIPSQVEDERTPGGFWPVAYGTVTTGGGRRTGTIYWWESNKRHLVHTLATFDPHGSQGRYPKGGLMLGFDGAMYGTTSDGGAHGVGTVFRVTTSGELSVMHDFDPALQEGARPTQTLTAGPDGNYYGVTNDGGALLQGALFRMAPDGTMTTLHALDADTDGGRPVAALTLAGDGRLYGVTTSGGKHRGGTLFAMSTDGTLEVLHHFQAAEGTVPMGTLLALPDGSLAGTCTLGGAGGNGTVFKFMPGSGKLVVRHAFAADGSEGSHPVAGLNLAINGYLYGTTRDGGANGGGTAYSVAP